MGGGGSGIRGKRTKRVVRTKSLAKNCHIFKGNWDRVEEDKGVWGGIWDKRGIRGGG